MNIKFKFTFFLAVALSSILASCSKTESYTDLLKKEQRASNWFLAQHTVCNEIPSDSIFISVEKVGENAPYYKMDDDGYVYMQVLKAEDKKDRVLPKTDEQVYFTFTRWDVEAMYSNNTLEISGEGNQDNFAGIAVNTFFLFNNYSSSASTRFGSGIQVPVSYLGYNSEVNILLKSYYGFYDEGVTCVPYKVNVRYFKAEY